MHGWPSDRMSDSEVMNWMMVGTGVMHIKVSEHENSVSINGEIEEQWRVWEGILSPEYVRYVRKTKVRKYFALSVALKFEFFLQ